MPFKKYFPIVLVSVLIVVALLSVWMSYHPPFFVTALTAQFATAQEADGGTDGGGTGDGGGSDSGGGTDGGGTGDGGSDSNGGTDSGGTGDSGGTDNGGTGDGGTDNSGTGDTGGTDSSGTGDGGTDNSGTGDNGTDNSGTGDTGSSPDSSGGTDSSGTGDNSDSNPPADSTPPDNGCQGNCGGGGDNPPPPPPPPPVTPACTLSLSLHAIQKGQSITVSWTSSNVTSGTLNPGNVNLTPVSGGSLTVSPQVNTTYTATFTGPNGSVTCSDSVTVTTTPPPKIPVCTLVASKDYIHKGESVVLTWTSENVTTGTLAPGNTNLTPVAGGSLTVTPSDDTTYTASFTGPHGSVSCTDTVKVKKDEIKTPYCTLSASPHSVKKGDAVTLTWTSQNVTSGSINQGVGNITPVSGGSVTVNPHDDTTYTATFTGPNGTVTCSDSVDVTKYPPPQTPVCTLTANPTSIAKGGNVTLTWTSQNVTSGTIDQGVGSITPVGGGSIVVNPQDDITYTATFTGSNGTVTCSAPVDVEGGGGGGNNPACTLSANKETISAGEAVVLTWTSSNVTSGSIDQGVGSTTPVSGGSVTVNPQDDITYTATFTGPNGTVNCSDSINVDGGGGGCSSDCNNDECEENCGGGGGGGSPKPKVTLSYKSSSDPLTYVTLTEIPYTGFPAGPVGTALFWTGLIIWSGVAAYFISVKGWGASWLQSLARLLNVRGSQEYARAVGFSDASNTLDQDYAQHFDADAVYYNMQEVALPQFVAPIERKEIQPTFNADAELRGSAVPEDLPVAHQMDTSDLYKTLEAKAHDEGVLLSQEALQYVVERSNTVEAGVTFLKDLIASAREAYPREDGWLHLNRERLEALVEGTTELKAEMPVAATATVAPSYFPKVQTVQPVAAFSDIPHVSRAQAAAPIRSEAKAEEVNGQAVPVFIGWICDGEGDKIFDFLRRVKLQGYSTREFLARVVATLDEVHRQKLEGGRSVDQYSLEKTGHLAPADIESLIDMLAVGVDYSYRDSHAGVKTALLRAMELVNRGQNRA